MRTALLAIFAPWMLLACSSGGDDAQPSARDASVTDAAAEATSTQSPTDAGVDARDTADAADGGHARYDAGEAACAQPFPAHCQLGDTCSLDCNRCTCVTNPVTDAAIWGCTTMACL